MYFLNRDAWPRLLRQMEVIVCTGSPGLYRVLSYLVVQHVYSLADLGNTVSAMSLAQMAGFFTAIGWATLILVRLPGVDEKQALADTFYRLGFQSLLITLILTIGALLLCVILPLLGHVRFDVKAFILLLWSWTAYQVARHYFVALRRYRTAIFFDIALIIFSAVTVVACKVMGLSSSVALAIAMFAIALPMFIVIGRPSKRIVRFRLEQGGLQFGLTNFLSGGISLVFTPAATLMCGAAFAGLLSLFSSLSAVGMLFPRAISIMTMSELAARRSAGKALQETLRRMRLGVGWSNGIVSCANALAVLLVALQKTPVPSQQTTAIMAGLLLIILCMTGTMGLVSSNIMAIFEKGGGAATVNFVSASLFGALFSGCLWVGGANGFLLVLISAITATAIQSTWITVKARAACAEYDRHYLHIVGEGR